MKQGWSCPSWHRSREQTQAGGRAGSSAKPSRGGRTCYRCLGWCGMWAEGSAHCTRVLLSFYSTEVICSSLWPDLIRRVGFLSSVFFFFFSFPMEYWIYHCPNIKIPGSFSALECGFCFLWTLTARLPWALFETAASRAEPWAWAPLIHSECHFEPFPA